MVLNDEVKNKIKSIVNPLRRRLAVCSWITEEFKKEGLYVPILVGGSAVAIYSNGMYATVDLDMKSEQFERYAPLMSSLGFNRVGKDFYHSELDTYVEFPSGRFEDSMDHVREVVVEETGWPIYISGYEDMIIDRALKFSATSDQNSREWALRMMGFLYDEIDWSYLHKKSNEYGILAIIERIQRDVKRYKGVYRAQRDKDNSTANIENSND
ncbi:hypothetical protein PA598K_01798 [Paenibacillus sp. 598K]|uniref:hypothetical protein n=1 Tax=Paenibacillus sp. 598K TaxID=1117987 RepID=UPI000FFA8510|nr:hypothetical protein [Paenibacillus sp. 598K]GBF73505.1 hypothetical protein PA598K_01798 [Paenibacillus sp. 598K]